MYELFVLGQLMDRPMTGYQLRKALVGVVGQELTISFGALYPLLDKLAGAGDLTLDFKTTTSKRPQKVATLTASGRQHFWALVLAPVALNKQTQLTFQIKLNFLHLLTRDQQLSVLTDFQAFAQGQLTRLATQKSHLQHNAHMLAADIADALLATSLQEQRAQVQFDWITALIQAKRAKEL
ncbi:helix-turn-helix transcriptional regulator [Lactiplantibacillus sp. WILCCON 0030]|uniref:Helix-turn-helix transcriptional regulator n=1 Tax=Lactiplantibacillus brownii TaxID=3069269 RepID=A0ABU1A5S4_9LACO|nr:helix-turn-helix transcriptional regulator [Lactiplantibacillus brownii]MDQ7936332.1 helix-turn-helix transcriptional regulator [Lactiplantibacillus brownii]